MKYFKITVIFCALLIVSNPLHAQWVLETLIPWDSTYTLSAPSFKAISVVDSSVSWVVGEYDQTWTNQMYICKRDFRGWREIKHHDLDTSYWNLNGIAAIDTTNAWVTNTKGKVFRTTNGGYNWLVQVSLAQNAYINGIVFSKSSRNIGYIFADAPGFTGIYILKTTNTGNSWVQQYINIPGYAGAYKSISVIDSLKAWMGLVSQSGNNPKLIMTTNGGVNWNIITINQNSNTPGNIQFSSNGLFGVCDVDNPSRILRTTNAGLNWSVANNFNETIWNTRWVEGSSVIYFQGLGQIQRSIDNGISISQMTVPFIPGFDNQIDLMDIIKINNNTIYGIAVTNSSKVIKLLDTLRVIGLTIQNYSVPNNFKLYQNYPNPFNPLTTFTFSLPKTDFVRISVFDILSRELETVLNLHLSAGTYSYEWDGSKYSSGVYFYKLESGDFAETRKMILMK